MTTTFTHTAEHPMSLQLVTGPSESITLVEAKLHLRVENSDDDSLISVLISAAREDCEHQLGRGIGSQTWRRTLDAFPSGGIELGMPPVSAVSSVQYVDPDTLDLIGAIGVTTLGHTGQDFNYPSWSFPATDFSGAPYFEIVADQVDLQVSGYPLPIFDFHLTGTFAEDGATFGGGVLQGLGDTRYSGGALGQPNNPRAMCNFGQGLGVACQPCPDGEVLCLKVDVHNLVARELPDVVLRPLGGAP